ncbi:unnamed protein product, partial [Ectocarpus sp. 12 AP-2014]
VEADTLYVRAIAIGEKSLGSDHPDVAVFHSNRALMLQNQGKHVEAEALYDRCQAIEEKVLGSEHPSLVATLSNRALLLTSQVRVEL